MEHIKQMNRLVVLSIQTKFFYLIFLLNFVCNLSSIWLFPNIWAFITIYLLSSLYSYIESAIYLLISKLSILQKIYKYTLITAKSVFIIVEYFLLMNFHKNFGADIIEIIQESNFNETKEFITNFISFSTIIAYCMPIGLLIVLLHFISVYLYRNKHTSFIFLISSCAGFFISIFCIIHFVIYHDGKNIPQLTTISRSSLAIYKFSKKNHQIELLCNTCKNIKVKQARQDGDKPTIIVVIGESHSYYHTSLYGYSKSTYPLLEKRLADSSLIAFDNAITPQPVTHAALIADYSLDSMGVNYENTALFPSCFKKAGYNVELYDNQYFLRQCVYFLCDENLSKTMFNYRNNDSYKYDGDMINDIKVKEVPSLYIIHLWGQHYTYNERYPKEFSKFRPSEYSKKYTTNQRKQIAEYDNACLYNDYIINTIIEKCKKLNCFVFYFSDHGEEVFETRNYMGHDTGGYFVDIRYLFHIPFFVWMSDKCRQSNPELYEKIKSIKHYPLSMDDIGHTLLDIANIDCKDFVKERSIVNSHYNTKRKRFVLDSIDYDKRIIDQKR